jgi:hypothetical protein
MLRSCDPLVNNSLTFEEKAESIKSPNTIKAGIFSGFSNSGTPLTNETFQMMWGVVFTMAPHDIFILCVTKLLPALQQSNYKS